MFLDIFKYFIVIFALILFIIFFIYKYYKNKNNINYIIKTYDNILIKKDKYEFKSKEKIYIKKIEDLIKISYELDKKISYINKDNKYTFILEDEDSYLIYEVNYENKSK